jgi:hypothetical protein
VIRTVPWPRIPRKGALIKVGACGVCGTDLHILKGHWPKQLPWPFTLGHELGGVIAEIGPDLREDFMGKPLDLGSKVMIPPLMPCGQCYYCIHYPESANKCLTPVYYGRYLVSANRLCLWGGWAEYVYRSPASPRHRITSCPTTWRCLGALSGAHLCIRAFNRARPEDWNGAIRSSFRARVRSASLRCGAGDGRRARDPHRRAGNAARALARKFGAQSTVNIEGSRRRTAHQAGAAISSATSAPIW